MAIFTYDLQQLTSDDVHHILFENPKISIGEQAKAKVTSCRNYLEKKLSSDQLYYGINTGFGSLCNVRISPTQLTLLQTNLVRSHACGMGDKVNDDIVRLIFFLKIVNLSQGYSGVRWALIEKMVEIYNAGILPIIYEQGSLGASGDLAPLAHLSLLLLGEGRCTVKGEEMDSFSALTEANINPITLEAKEGLALLNGTQFSLAHSLYVLLLGAKLMAEALKISALSLEAYGSSKDPFTFQIHQIRNNSHQQQVADKIYEIINQSEIIKSSNYSVQDPYSFRCIPQVLGASFQAFSHFNEVVINELNAVTDNPNIFAEYDLILSGGNFHAQPLALVLDYVAIAIAEVASISERRTYQLINGDRDLPPFLTPNAGLNSGFMIAQYTAASIVSQNKQLCSPASVDSIISSKGQEDHVSMAANAATKCIKVLDNAFSVLAIEALCASQALDFRNLKPSNESLLLKHKIRNVVSFMEEDRYLKPDIDQVKSILIHQ